MKISICGDDIDSIDCDAISDIVNDALRDKGIDFTSFAWSIDIELDAAYVDDIDDVGCIGCDGQ
jgi:hypothetical protein